jgi:AAA+ ATPase superfamily predicted ATPase
MSTDAKTVWTRVNGKKPKREAILVGRQISPQWLSGTVDLTQVRLTGEMKQVFEELIAASKAAKLNLPIVSLRTALIFRMENVVTVDKDLGLVASRNGAYPCAVELYSPPDEDLPSVREAWAQVVKRWIMDEVEVWAEKHQMGHLVRRLRETVSSSAIELVSIQAPYIGENGYPDFRLIARSIGEQLVGEELFEGLGNCELVASPEYRSNSVELMTLPRRGSNSDETFSMVARLTVASMPYSKHVYLSVSAVKRVWAKKPPAAVFGAPRSVTAYVLAVGRPVTKVDVVKTGNGWEFGEEYATLRRESLDKLPSSLSDAIAQREFDVVSGWWSGLPELPSLFRSVSPRTVFESDEISLLHTVSGLLKLIVSDRPIQFNEVKLPRFQTKPLQEMLKLSDFGVAGAAFSAGGDTDDGEIEGLEQNDGTREEKLQRYRAQNMEALRRVHGTTTPVVWMLGGNPSEQELTRRTIGILFGDGVEVNTESLPAYTHGLRADLDHPEYSARKRFDERVTRWHAATETIKAVSGERHIVVLICAPERVGKKHEDAVNYYAGIHAMAAIGANVHHVLPIENPDDPKSKQGFVHRVQSAILDVMLAHTGAVFGVKEFVERLLPLEKIPIAIYGVQAIRSRPQARSGQTGVNCILYSRVVVANGMTEVRIGFRDGPRNQLTNWMPLSKALSWIGSQRRMQDGDAGWLKAAFVDLTRSALIAIAEDDPKAIVLIEWDSVRSLWKGISDADLASGNGPRLESSSLAQFKDMAFIRLRRGADTLSLRTSVKATFMGWKESGGVRSDTGEIKLDTYATTDMRLVEVADEASPEGRSYGHYIASMGYAKTVQVKRGFSCYRAMPRMCRMGQGSTEFEQRVLDVAAMDASLPAPMDVSVMSSPSGVGSKQYAVLSMGLRLGYAHYNDWTTLPMPLFFRRKIEDYVIRYPDEVDDTTVEDSAIGDVTEPAISSTLYSELVVQEAQGVEEPPRMLVETTPDVLGIPGADSGDDLLSRAKRTSMPFIREHKDYHSRRLYQRMLNGGADVRVNLPYWVKTRGVFAITGVVTKRGVRRSWDWIKDLGYVKSGTSMPRVDEYLDWLSAKLRVPQVCATIVWATREFGQINFRPLVDVIERDYNSTVRAEERVTPFSLEDDMLIRLVRWADVQRHDELMGWLVFMAAQLPYPESAGRLVQNIYTVPGPRTEHALEYFLSTASAINAALEQKHARGHITVLRELPEPTLEEPPPFASPDVQESSPSQTNTDPEIALVAPKSTTTEPAEVADLIMSTKEDLMQLIGEIEPGSDSFDATRATIEAQFGALIEIHAAKKKQNAAAAAIADNINRLIERQTATAEQINAFGQINRVGTTPIQQNDMETAIDELSKIDEAISDLSALLMQLDELEKSATPSNLQERKKRKDVEQQITDSALSRVEGLRSLIHNGLCFYFDLTSNPTEAAPNCAPITTATETVTPETPELLAVVPESDATRVECGAPTADTEGKLFLSEHAPHVTALVDVFIAGTPSDKDVKPQPAQPVALPVSEEAPPIPSAPPLNMAAPRIEVEADVSEGEDSAHGADSLDSKIPTLRKLFDSRLYGLADVHMVAISRMIEESDDGELQLHNSILAALVRALSSMDCQFSFGMKLDSQLSEFLLAEKLPSGQLSSPGHTALGVLAAGLGNMLFDDSDVRWRIGNAVSARVADHPSLSGLVDHLDLIRQRGFTLTRDLFARSRIGDKNALELELTRYRKRAEGWKTEPAIHSSFNHRAYAALHSELYSPKNPIGKCLALIAKGETTKVSDAFEETRRRFEKPAQTVEDFFKRTGERAKPQGHYRIQAIENIEATAKFVESYVDLINRRNSHSDELSPDKQSFLDGLNRLLKDAIREVHHFSSRNHLEALYCDAAIKAFECTIRLFDVQEPAACIPDGKQKLVLQWPIGVDLMPAMTGPDKLTPPLCTPDDVFLQTARLAEEKLTLDDPSSDEYIDKVLADAYQGHVAAKRFLPAFLIEAMLAKGAVAKGQTLIQQWVKERDALTAELQEARQKVAHAMTLNALPQEETNRMQWLIEELLRLCRSERAIGMPNGESTTYPDFPHARAALRWNVLQPLDARLSERKARLQIDLEDEEKKGLVPVADIVRIRSMLESNNAATLRTAHDALTMLRQSGKLPDRMLGTGNLAEDYDAFLDELRSSTHRNKHLLDEIKRLLAAGPPSEEEPGWLSRLDVDQRGEAREMIEAWITFFATRNPSSVELTERLFRAMGFTIPPVHYQEHSRGNRAKFLVDDQTFRFPTTPDDPMFIPPVLGSWATHTQCYALFGATQENDIRLLMQEIENVPTLVLTRTNLNMQKRAKVSSNSPVLLIDDDLIAYAALHPGERLQSLIKVGMLTFTANPYDDYNTKPVPPEMFFGRKEELDRLRGVKGLAVLYGGRRLGKSSLLNQIEQESRRTRGQAAVYISMDTINTAGDYVLSAWEFVYRALVNRKIIEPISPLPLQWKSIMQHVERNLIDSRSVKSLFLLLDEADNLIGRELRRKRDEDSFVRSLTQMSDNVADTCQVRMVITGLHNVTRMANDENSVFGKADPIPLKPFTSSDDVQRGIRLITKPLAAMGYLFGAEAADLPLRILSVCNFYPAFIQLYCKRLVEHLQNSRQDKKPPFMITSEILDVVEKDSNLMSELREKFKLNLNLDKRYKAIALILADVYYSEIEDGQYSGLTASEIREYCEAYCGRHFENTGPGVYEALLDEMSKLNVVEKVGTRYVLRNPNIAMMVGDRDRVTTLINELANEPAEMSRNQGERRILMTRNNSQMIFPMPMSWIRNHMDASDGELLILTGNVLSGILDLSQVERDEWRLQDGVFSSVPGNGPHNLADQVTRSRRISQDHRAPKIMSVRNAAWRVDQIPEYAAIANKASKVGIRIILLAHPERGLELTLALESGALKPNSDASRAWRVVPIPQWSEDAIYYWVHENIAIAESGEAIAAIKTATCGFGKEVNALCGPHLTLEIALSSPKTRRQFLAPNLETFYQRIGMPPSLIEKQGEAIKNLLVLVNGADRGNIAEIDEIMLEFGISKAMFDFLYWMGLVQEGPEHTWRLPALVAELIH